MLGDEEIKEEKEDAEKEEDLKNENQKEAESDKSSEWDDEEEGGQWITQDNLYSNIGGAGGNLLQNNDNELFANQLKVDESKDSVVTPDPAPNTSNEKVEEKKAEQVKPANKN